MRQLKTIYQSKQTDCGAAAVATLCSIDYGEAAAIVYKGRRVGITASGRLLDAIKHFGRTPLATRCAAIGDSDLRKLKHDALLKCKLLYDRKTYTHWAVWDSAGQTIRDPYGYKLPLKVTHVIEVA